jgi:hypothetical protein
MTFYKILERQDCFQAVNADNMADIKGIATC